MINLVKRVFKIQIHSVDLVSTVQRLMNILEIVQKL
jgi:hypothetical protein